ncbi:hypothetical protein TNCV_4383711 [Trichonephila clavipes]|nr:hypothetical protein TNCV_4383711 [Trichonephila clavipes]
MAQRVMSSILVLLKTRRVGGHCAFKLSKLKLPPDGVEWKLREEGASSGVVLVTLPWYKMTRSVAKSPRVAEQCDVNIHSLT